MGHFWVFARVFGMLMLMFQFENVAVASINEKVMIFTKHF
jgi:hypothetical protein